MQYLFRGKRKDNGEWIYGSLLQWPNGEMEIVVFDGGTTASKYNVIPETVGTYIDRNDKEYKQIFTGDILSLRIGGVDYITVVKWNNGNSKFEATYVGPEGEWIDNGLIVDIGQLSCYPIIGNIHDNPELVNPTAKEQL